MPVSRLPYIGAAILFAAMFCLSVVQTRAQQLPLDVGTTVPGYQDDFDDAALGAGWTVRGQNVYTVSGGMLHVASAGGDPNHLLYELGGYNNTVQEVLARIRVTSFGTADGPRGGVAVGVDAGTSRGINLHFRDEGIGRHVEFLDDGLAWGTEFAIGWQNNTWYWLRLRQEPNAAAQGGVNDVFGKIWLADGSQAEPAAWQSVYDYIPTRAARTGFAGIAASSLGGTAEFDVDYILIKATGLPNVTVAPNAFVQTPVAITNQPQSQSVLICDAVTLNVGVRGNPRPALQWFRDSAPLAGATNTTFSLPRVAISDNGAQFYVIASNVVSNVLYSVTSSPAVLTVSGDTVPPMISAVQSLGLEQVQLKFSLPMAFATTTNVGNYAITNSNGALAIASADLDSSQSNLVLTVSQMMEGANYTIVINNVTDGCSQNVIATDTTASFTASSYAGQDIGGSVPAGLTVPVAGGYDITGGGTDIGGTNDQFQFTWQQRTGNFDVRVRLASLSLADAWSEAGLMARESLVGGSRFASAMGTPSISGCYFQSRGTTPGAGTLSGSFPANYPNTWLRLQRVGNQFTGYASYDGESWTPLGSASIAMPAAVYFGFAVSSHNTNQLTTAAFRDISTVTNPTTNTMRLASEPLSQSSRRTSLVISEIMYHPAERADGRNTEFVELFNTLGEPADISGYRLSGEVEYTFPPNTILPGGGFLVVARVPADLESIYGITGVLGPFANTNNLPNNSGTIRLRHRTGAVFIEANYSSDFPYPLAADGSGHSLVLAQPSYGEGNAQAWAASDSVGGSPGRLDPVTPDPLRNVMVNEFLAHTDLPEVDYVELYNHSNDPIDISGCFLSDNPNTNKFIVPPGTTIPPRGFVVFHETNLNFALSSHGEEIYFCNPSDARVLDAVRFGAQENGVSMGRSPNGAASFYRMATKTPGASNSAPRASDLVINEIMYNPITGSSDDEFVELYNRGTNAIDLYRWKLSGGISFTFQQGTVIPPNGYLVVANNISNLLARNSNLNPGNAVGNYGGSLGNSSDRIALSKPEFEVSTNAPGQFVTNTVDIVVNEVTYRDGGRWGQWSDGGGSSLELIDSRSDNRLAANWADSDETSKGPWTAVSVTGVLDNGLSPADQLQVLLQGAGECLIDNVEVLTAAGANLIANSTFEGGVTGWTAEGTQEQSGGEPTEGFGGGRSYHVRAPARGDNQVNRIRTPLSAAQAAGGTNTIRAKVRWLRGHPEILFRLRGNWLEAAVSMILPTNLGTPGAANSRALPNAAPAIYDVAHYPPLPAANEPVLVTARVHDVDGMSSLQVRYRVDPSATLNPVDMLDNGTAGDAVAGDGLYTARIPGQPANTLVAFRVQATDAFTPSAASTFPNNAPTRECLVRFGESVPTGNFPSYRIWMTQATFNTWDGRNNLNNTVNDITFVLGNHRVIYNAGAVFAGSPYISPGFNTPTGNRCGYSIDFPSDEPLLGDNGLNLDWPGGHGNENTAVQEEMAYWIADQMNIPFSHRYFIRLTVNGVTDMQRGGVFEAALQPGTDFLEQWSPDDSDGDFFRIDRSFEFNDAGGLITDPQPQLLVYSTPDLVHGGTKKKTERYRWMWLKRAFDRANDYTNLFVIADVLNSASPEPYTFQTEALADVDEWMGVFAAEHIINNFDSWGHDIGKNMYMFKPRNGRWQLYMFDLDWLM
ncbi:MAG TPA: lamin tail domain-containing protein, partial [Methylomirabilota bacterium]|nr:lamin tail domain-containing protein [Methylomirabilota bacterium]